MGRADGIFGAMHFRFLGYLASIFGVGEQSRTWLPVRVQIETWAD